MTSVLVYTGNRTTRDELAEGRPVVLADVVAAFRPIARETHSADGFTTDVEPSAEWVAVEVPFGSRVHGEQLFCLGAPRLATGVLGLLSAAAVLDKARRGLDGFALKRPARGPCPAPRPNPGEVLADAD